MRRTLLALALAAAGCGSSTPSPAATSDTTTSSDSTSADTSTASDNDATADSVAGTRTLASCSTAIASDAPAFARLFKCATVTKTATGWTFKTDSLPPHASPYWSATDPNYTKFDTTGGKNQNPNTLKKTTVTFTIPATPVAKGITVTAKHVDGQAKTSNDEYALGPAGIALDGVLVFNATAAPGDDIAKEAFTFDSYDAHPAPTGEYHYHGPSKGPLEVLKALGHVTKTEPGKAELEVYGIMCDGTVLLGCTEADGNAAPVAGLDPQGGHVHAIKGKDGKVWFDDRYHVHMCAATGRIYTPEIQYYKDCGIQK
jgi:hypothetical protein